MNAHVNTQVNTQVTAQVDTPVVAQATPGVAVGDPSSDEDGVGMVLDPRTGTKRRLAAELDKALAQESDMGLNDEALVVAEKVVIS